MPHPYSGERMILTLTNKYVCPNAGKAKKVGLVVDPSKTHYLSLKLADIDSENRPS